MQNISESLNAALNSSEVAQRNDLLNICRAMITDTYRRRGFTKEIPRADLDQSAAAWVDALKSYSLGEIHEMYQRALRDYKDTEIPFGVPQLINAAQALTAEKRQKITTAPCLICTAHKWIDGPREENDPPMIESWRICENCGAVFARIRKTA